MFSSYAFVQVAQVWEAWEQCWLEAPQLLLQLMELIIWHMVPMAITVVALVIWLVDLLMVESLSMGSMESSSMESLASMGCLVVKKVILGAESSRSGSNLPVFWA